MATELLETIARAFGIDTSDFNGTEPDAYWSRMGEVVFDNYPAFHNKLDVLKFGDVGKRVACNGNDVREFACNDRSHGILPPEEFSSSRGSRANRFNRRQPKFCHSDDLVCVR